MTSNAITAGSTAITSAVTELTPKLNPSLSGQPTPQANSAATAAADAPPDARHQEVERTKGKDVASKNAQTANAIDRDELAKAVDEINASYKSLRRTGLQFSIDDKADELVVKVMDVDKDEVIRQIPPEDLLELAAFLKEQAAQQKDHNPWTALTERNQALKIPAEGWLVNAKA